MKFENIEYRKADFFDVDLSKPDAIIFYQSIYEMGRLGEKLMNEVGPDHIVVSNRFKLTAGWENYSEEIPLEKQGPLQKNINVYRKPEAA